MKKSLFLLIFLGISTTLNAQIIETETSKMGYILQEKDTIFDEPIQLEEVVIIKQKWDPVAKKEFILLRNRVFKVYPYAKIAAERLTALNQSMNSLETNREKRKYFKIVENYLENEFEAQLKKLSRKQGQILVKLICRQTGISTYNLIKNYKSGWKAFWSNTTAWAFDISLKTIYNPMDVNEDFLIETILQRAFDSGRLIKQEAANPIDFDQMVTIWNEKAIKKSE